MTILSYNTIHYYRATVAVGQASTVGMLQYKQLTIRSYTTAGYYPSINTQHIHTLGDYNVHYMNHY